jgi:acyl-CoA thioester hydrolase
MIRSSSQIRVRYAETDTMGVAYHGNYLTWFEVARVELFDALGAPYVGFEKEGYYLPVLSAQANYMKPARFDDRLIVTVMMKQKPRARIYLEYAVECNGQLLATGNTEHGFMDAAGKGMRPPNRFIDLIERAWSVGEVLE